MLEEKHILFFVLFVILLVLFYLGISILSTPFKYPYYKKTFDVSRKRKPDIENLIEQFICNGGFYEIREHFERIEKWKSECELQIEASFLKKLRRKQFEQCIDDYNAYHFYLVRIQTRYIQRNYIRTPYQVTQNVDFLSCDFDWLSKKYNALESIGFEATLKDYHSKNQRKLMTRELRESIMKRDNYTCQICGKYMPDEVGLQIDHIIPVSKGGKSVKSNLRVLCSKCNGCKSDKF